MDATVGVQRGQYKRLDGVDRIAGPLNESELAT